MPPFDRNIFDRNTQQHEILDLQSMRSRVKYDSATVTVREQRIKITSHHAFNPVRQALRRYISMPLLVRSAPLEGIKTRKKIMADFIQDIGMKVSIGHRP